MTRLISRYTLVSAALLPLAAHAGLTSITIVNPGFQADNYGTFPGYNGGANPVQPTGWAQSGGGGINGTDIGAGTPFSDGSQLDGTRVGFIQGTGNISQTLNGLIPGKQYYFQGYFRGRNCCGDVPVISATFGGAPLITNVNIGAATWVPFSISFTATAASGLLNISSFASLGGDASVAFDGITMYQLDSDYVPLWNPSFEAGGVSFAFPGYMATGFSDSNMAGWTKSGSGNVGYNYAGNNPFADNGAIPEGQVVGFIQNDSTLSQVVNGLTAGQQYLLEVDYNARAATGQGRFAVSLGGTTLLDDTFTPNGSYKHLAALWTATGGSATLSLSGFNLTGDNSVVFDNVTLRAIPEPASAAVLAAAAAGLAMRRRR
jgi:hypothetical protein